MGAAREATTLGDILTDFKAKFQELEADLRNRRGFDSTETKPIGTSSGTSPGGITGFLKSSGDQMTGVFALGPGITTIQSGIADISQALSESFTSFILLNPEGGVDDILETLTGVAFPGQIAVIYVTNASVIFPNSGNMVGNGIKVDAGDNIVFIYNIVNNKWEIWNGGFLNTTTVSANSTWKLPVRAKSDGFTATFPNIQQVIDGVTLVEDDRVLLTDELMGQNNGIWKVNGPFVGNPLLAPLIRPDDFNSDSDMLSETFVAVEEGDNNKETVWHLVTPNPILDAVTSQSWLLFGVGAAGEFLGPWTANHDAGNFTLNNIASLQITDNIGGLHGSLQGLAGSGIRLSLISGEEFEIFSNITSILKISNTIGLEMVGSHVIKMGNNIINTIRELQFSNSNIHTPSNENTIGFDTADKALKYSVALTTDSHRFYANTDLLASFSRIGSNAGLLSVQAVTATFLQAIETLFLSTFTNSSPTNGEIWRDSSSGKFKARENGITFDLINGGGEFLGPWTANHDAGGFDLTNIDDLTFAGSSSLINLNGGNLTNFDSLQSQGGSSMINMIGGDINMGGGEIDMGGGNITDISDLRLALGGNILADGSIEIGIQIDNVAATTGSAGMLAMPVFDITTVLTVALLNGTFGTHKGAMGIDHNNLTNSRLWVKDSDGGWLGFDYVLKIT